MIVGVAVALVKAENIVNRSHNWNREQLDWDAVVEHVDEVGASVSRGLRELGALRTAVPRSPGRLQYGHLQFRAG